MEKVIKKTIPVPKPLNNCTAKINKALREKSNHSFSGYYYASDAVKRRLEKIYSNKCAFCESDTTAGAVLQVEHYRPKAKVTDEPTHEGYYWLGYEWTNLLYACSSCNRAKSTSFPISGIRVFHPPMSGTSLNTDKCKVNDDDLKNEEPLLLNPEENDFKPMDHLIISPNGKIRGISNRGEATIEKCKLGRKNLKIVRNKIVADHLRYMMKDFERYKREKIDKSKLEYGLQKEIERIIDRINNNEPYTLLARYMLKYFDYFFIKQFKRQVRKLYFLKSEAVL